ncbi:slipin family protein [Corallococcus sp. H22C18031201]|uniref:slipin family protein n=1 Tax=Citreicoccus inhibens TaxID=2849499 RepID=UPI000E7692F5|nr:slipin family protein [Citreicoccus inhibens]MBU8898826.1 slipin family protein [Citreicoccus inhibens]RJS24016.1 slipin family protein [Corallococcus sp. H22C18031201]
MNELASALGTLIPLGLLFLLFLSGVRIVNEYQNGVVFRLGRYVGLKRAGFRWLIPFIERMVIIDLRTVARDVPPQDVITRDNVSVKVSAVVYFRVIHAEKAVLQVEDYLYATSQLAQTTLRAILGQVELDELLSQRDRVNRELQKVLDAHTDPWGIKISNVEVKHIDLPVEMQRAIARQAEAERERRAKIIAAEGEHQAAERLGQAADVLSRNPASLQLRYLQTLVEITGGGNHTILPIPLELMNALGTAVERRAREDGAATSEAAPPAPH